MTGWKVKSATDGQIQCSLCSVKSVYLEPVPHSKIDILMEEYPHQEWLGYLVGRMEADNILVEDLVIPPHSSVSAVSAEAEPFHTPERCVGFIHSHHSMGAFHSGTDQDYVDKNYPVSITVAKNGSGLSYDAISYATTPCGKHTVQKVNVLYVKPKPSFNEEKFLKEAKNNIDKSKQVTVFKDNKVSPYLPLKYRVDDKGRVITQSDYNEIMKDLYPDW